MASITIKGTEYKLRMDLHAMQVIEDEYGDLKNAFEAFRNQGGKRRSVKMTKLMFRALANSGRRKDGLPEDVTGDEIDDFNLGDLNNLSIALNKAMEEAMHAETVNGNEADDDVHDEYMEQIEEQEKNV